MFDLLGKLGIIVLVVCAAAGATLAQDRPGDKKGPGGKVKTEEQAAQDTGEEGDVIEIVMKIPKPEVAVFSGSMRTRYREIGYEKSFTDKIIDAAKKSPF